mgnify:CR=1 FL=1
MRETRRDLDRLDGEMSTLGRFGSTAALTTMAVCAGVPLHFLVRTLEGLPVEPISAINLALVIAVIAALDVDPIYAVPLAYHDEGMDREVLRHFRLPFDTSPDLVRWRSIVESIRDAEGEVRIAVVGKYTNLLDSYKSLAEALRHGGIANKVNVKLDWVDSEIFEKPDAVMRLEGVHGILVQLPLPKHIDERTVLRAVDPKKDVDGFHPSNAGLLLTGEPAPRACTPGAAGPGSRAATCIPPRAPGSTTTTGSRPLTPRCWRRPPTPAPTSSTSGWATLICPPPPTSSPNSSRPPASRAPIVIPPRRASRVFAARRPDTTSAVSA